MAGYEAGLKQVENVSRKMVREYATRLATLGLHKHLNPEGRGVRGMHALLCAPTSNNTRHGGTAMAQSTELFG